MTTNQITRESRYEIHKNDGGGTPLQTVTGDGTAVMAANAHRAWNPDDKIIVVGIGIPDEKLPKPQDFIDVLAGAVAESGHTDADGNYNEPDEPETEFVQQAQPELSEALDSAPEDELPLVVKPFEKMNITDLRRAASHAGLKKAYSGYTKSDLLDYLRERYA